MISDAFQNSQIWTNAILVDAAWFLIALSLVWVGMNAWFRRQSLAAETGLASNILPIAGLLLVMGGSRPFELLLGIELVSWGQFLGSRPQGITARRNRDSNLTPGFLSLMLIVTGIALCDLGPVQSSSPRVIPFGYLLICFGLVWKFWAIPLRSLLTDGASDFHSRRVFTQLMWGIPVSHFLHTRIVNDLPADIATRIHVVLIVISIALMVFGATLTSRAIGWRQLLAGVFTLFYGQFLWGLSIRLWELASPDRNLAGINDWPSAEQVMHFIVLTWILGLTGVCVCLANVNRKGPIPNDFEFLTGIGKDQPLTAGVLILSLISLAGLPLTPGFWTTLFLLITSVSSQIQSSLTELYRPHTGFLLLTLIAVLSLSTGVFKVVRVVGQIWFGFRRQRFIGTSSWMRQILIVVIGVLTFVVGLLPGLPLEMTKRRETAVSIRANPVDAISHLQD